MQIQTETTKHVNYRNSRFKEKGKTVKCMLFCLFRSQQAQAVDRDVLPWCDHREHGHGAAGPSAGRSRQGCPGPLCW